MKKQGVPLLVVTLIALGLASAQNNATQAPVNAVMNARTIPPGECKIRAAGDGKAVLSFTNGSDLVAVPLPTGSWRGIEKSKPMDDGDRRCAGCHNGATITLPGGDITRHL
ncbi:MAG: hypothetical protein ABSA80_16850 [Terriglobales bacterium]|jgi:hypothetical protein